MVNQVAYSAFAWWEGNVGHNRDDGDDDAGRASDHHIRDAVRQQLQALFGREHWQVHVEDGHVVICDRRGDPVEHHVASNIASAISGVKSVDALRRRACPHHGSTVGSRADPGFF